MSSPAPGAEGSVPRRVWGATLLFALGRQWGTLCTIAALAILARTLAPEAFGRFTFYLALFAFLDVLVDCGTSTVALQRSAAGETSFAAAIAAGRRVRLVTGALAALTVLAVAAAYREEGLGWVALAALSPLARTVEMSAVVFQRDIDWGWPVALRAAGATLRLGALASLALLGVAGFGPYLAAQAGGVALGNLALHLAARTRLPQPPRRSEPAAGLLRAALPLALTGLVQQAYFQVDNLFVRTWQGEAELGRYNACVRVFSWLVFFAAFATSSALPWLARRAHAGDLGAAATRLAQPILVAASAAVGILWPWSAEGLRLVFGPGFEEAAGSLRWLLAAVLAVAVGACFFTAVIATGRSRAALGIALSALAVKLAASGLLVPRLGIEGAALSTLATESTVAVLALVTLRRDRAAPRAGARWLLAPAALAAASFLSATLHATLTGS